jgi:hypothetical protein
MSPAARFRDEHRRVPRCALLPCMAALLTPLFALSAGADIYKWVDENGATVITNVRPAKIPYARNFEVVQKDEPGQSSRAGRKPAATEQALQDRIERLERELRAERAARQAQGQPPASYAPAYAPPAPAVSYYTPYPDYYAPSYSSALPVYSAGVFLPARPVVAHRFVVRGGFGHGSFAHPGFGHRGRR